MWKIRCVSALNHGIILILNKEIHYEVQKLWV